MKTDLIDEDNKIKVLEYLKNRKKNIVENNPNWNKTNLEWKKFYFYPLNSAILKIEDDIFDFNKLEILIIESCINENKIKI